MGGIFCLHEKTGLTGTVTLENKDIELHLRSFSQPIKIEDGLDEEVRLETGEVCALFDTFGTTDFLTRLIGNYVMIRANIAVVGNRGWQRSDHPERILFSLDEAESDFLVHRERVSAISVGWRRDSPELNIFACEGTTIKVEADYWPRSRGRTAEVGVSISPIIAIVLKEPQDLHSCLGEIFNFITFVSAIHGRYIGDRDVRLKATMDSSISTSPEFFRVYYDRSYSTQTGKSDPVFSCHDDHRTHEFVCALREWLNRAADWKLRNWLMVKSLSQRGSLHAERLLTATRWFESFPESKAQCSLSKEFIDRLCEHIAGLDSISSESHFQRRLRGCLNTLRHETRREVLHRVVGDVESFFGKEWVTEKLVSDIELAYKLRGSAAHAELDLREKKDVKDALRAVCGLEYLCLLLTFRGIPLGEHALSRLELHPLVRAYTALDRDGRKTG
jgi:hypothetical protein